MPETTKNSSIATTTRVSILALSESSMMSLASIIDPLRAANRLSRQPVFKWRIISMSGQAIELTSGIKISADAGLSETERGDVLIVLSGFNHDRHLSKQNLAALRQAATHFKFVLGVEAGTWVLARAGVITSQRVTTHWEDLENLAFAYPSLEVVAERFVIDQRIWTSGGASPALDMMLHYLRTFQNESLAMDVASAFIYNQTSAATDEQPLVSLGRLESLEPRLAKAIRLMESHLEEPLSTQQLAKQVKLSVRMLELLCTKHLGLSPGAYYLRLRLQAARRLVLDTKLPLLDISIRSGFKSHTAFSRAFKQRYNFSPSSLRRRAA